jgi:hypothetical protein
VKKSIVTIIIIVLCLSMFSSFSLKANAASVPNGIVYSIPLTLTNTQSVATPAPCQQMISVDSSKYSSYEAPNLQNIEFFDSSGSVIYSWIESGAASSSTNTIYWLNLPNGIAAKSSVTIYLGFASPTTNLLNGQTIGEAPTLNTNYGQYDNGRNVFTFYDNFAGNTLSNLWVDNSAQTENTFTIDKGITVQPAQAFNNWTSINSVNTFSQGVTEFYGTIPTGDGTATFDGVLVGLICQSGWDSMIGCVAGSYGLITKDGGNWNTAEGLSFGVVNIYSLYVPSATSSLRLAEVNYGSTISGNSNPLTLPQPIGLQNQRRSGLTLGPIYWIRERSYPPNGVMPTVLVNGQTSSKPQSNSIFSNPLVIAAIIAAILAGVGAVMYYFVVIGGGGAGSTGTGASGGVVGSVDGSDGSVGAGSGGGADSSGGEGEGSGGGGETELKTYEQQGKVADLSASSNLNTTSQAQNQPGQQDQYNYGMGLGSENRLPSNQSSNEDVKEYASNDNPNDNPPPPQQAKPTQTQTQEPSSDEGTQQYAGEPSPDSEEA